MKKNHSQLVERLLREMQLRNYSPRTIHTYGELMSKVENFFHLPIDKITTNQFKDYLHRRITQEGISTSCVNQYISAFKILQTDVLKHNWEDIKIKRPRRTKSFRLCYRLPK
ncbi:MAG: phage integrase N-terminal SAM-like domain-containing protein [Bacteroidetes bacterium]|nr:phage integrase N-terminal SAM-like domain-containing protein [Bacteroidota bacterium]